MDQISTAFADRRASSWFNFVAASAIALSCATAKPAKKANHSAGDPEEVSAEQKKPEAKAGLQETSAVTHGSLEIDGKKIPYKTTAGTIVLEKVGKRPSASVFYIAYEREGVKSRSERPVMFCFNGGPGSSSVWLHLGAFGPKRVKLGKDGTSVPAPPYRLVENAQSLLDVSDLVFVDPVSTGYSRAEKDEEAGAFHGFQEDIDSVADFVRLYVTREGRWASPKYLAGESYGAIRASGLAATLQDRFGMYLNGVVIISGVWDFRTVMAHTANDLPHMLYLPTMAATAHYHGQIEGDLEKIVADAEDFALSDYALALHQGAALGEKERKRIAQKLAGFTGVDAEVIDRANLRLSSFFFRKELLRDEGKTVGRFDGRTIGRDAQDLGDHPRYDPSYTLIYGAYSSTLNHYLRGELEYKSDLPYEILSSKVRPWSYDKFTNRYVNVADHVSSALQKNKDLRYFIACGYYDLATPHYGIEYSLQHLDIPKDLRANFTLERYQGGHMMYNNPEALQALKDDLSKFMRPKAKR